MASVAAGDSPAKLQVKVKCRGRVARDHTGLPANSRIASNSGCIYWIWNFDSWAVPA